MYGLLLPHPNTKNWIQHVMSPVFSTSCLLSSARHVPCLLYVMSPVFSTSCLLSSVRHVSCLQRVMSPVFSVTRLLSSLRHVCLHYVMSPVFSTSCLLNSLRHASCLHYVMSPVFNTSCLMSSLHHACLQHVMSPVFTMSCLVFSTSCILSSIRHVSSSLRHVSCLQYVMSHVTASCLLSSKIASNDIHSSYVRESRIGHASSALSLRRRDRISSGTLPSGISWLFSAPPRPILRQYRYGLHNDVSVNDGRLIRRWP